MPSLLVYRKVTDFVYPETLLSSFIGIFCAQDHITRQQPSSCPSLRSEASTLALCSWLADIRGAILSRTMHVGVQGGKER